MTGQRPGLDEAEAERDALRRELLSETYRPEGGEIVMRELIRAKAERDSALAELARVREAVEALADKWASATDLTTGNASLVTWAFAQELRAALSDAGQPQTGDSE